ncbi:MAG: DUF177 domain-containing protein [Erysipelotrichaceae bacterium]
MRWQRKELAALKTIELETSFTIDPSLFASNGLLKEIKEVYVEGQVKYDERQDIVYVDLMIDGVMICPCAITNEDVEHTFETNFNDIFSFFKAEAYDAYPIEADELDLEPYLQDIVMQEVPLKVVKKGEIVYPKGDGWHVSTEEEYEKSREEKLDPRLAVLQNYQFNDKEE